MSRNLPWKFALILVLLVAAVVELVSGELRLGFDLKGGVELHYKIQGALTSEELKTLSAAEIAKRQKEVASSTAVAIAIIQRRLDPTGVKPPDIRSETSGEIIIRLPGLTPEEVTSIKRRAEEMGLLEFRAVVRKEVYDKMSVEEKSTVKLMRMKLRKKGEERESYEDLYIQTQDKYNITGQMLRRVYPAMDDVGAPALGFEFGAQGAKLFSEMTRVLKGERLAIILNGVLQSAPRVEEVIRERGIIRGDFTQAEVEDLKAVLQAGSLPAALILQSETFVGPELGTDSRDRGYFAAELSFVLVLLFMLVYYTVSGAIADLALGLNLVFLLSVMMLTDAVMTLPGIAGTVLTLAMAVDANVLIYERVREELQQGQSLRFAIKNGYDRAFITIVDCNLTTLITAIVLYWQGTGPVRGFAVTLTIGLVVSMFTALFVTRTVFDFLIAKGWLKERLPMLKLFSKTRIRFMRWAPLAVLVSVTSIVVGMAVFIWRGHDNYGIDFASGVSMHLQLKGLAVKTSEVVPSPGAKESHFTVKFFDRKGAETLSPVEVTRELVEEGLTRLSRLKDKNRLESREAVTVAWEKDKERSPAVELRVAEPEGGVAAGKALARLIDERGKDVFRMRMDIKDVRRMVAEAGYPGADVQTAFQDEAIVGLRDSDQFAIRVRGKSAADTQEEREAVPTNIEQAFSDLVDHRGVDTQLSVAPPTDNSTGGKNARMILRFVEVNAQDNTTVPMGLRRNHVEHSLRKAGFGELAVEWPKVERKYYDEIAFTCPLTEKDKIVKGLTAKDVFTFPAAFSGYYFVNPGQARRIILQAWFASGLSFGAIMVYVWLRFGALKYGVAAVASLVHDVLFTLGVLAMAAWLAETAFGAKLGIGDVRLSLPVVAGILTLIGYSINDTIVVFDRIRENLRHRIRELRGRRSGEEVLTPELIDQAINQTLSRTILTSITTWIVSLTLFIAGGASLHGLSLCLTVGILTGTYSSIAIASPILVIGHWWEVRRARAIGEMTAEEKDVALERGKTSQGG